MSLTVEQVFNAIAPEFQNNPSKDVFLSLAAGRTNTRFFREHAVQATALRAAHMMTLSNRHLSAPGAVTALSEGDLRVSMASPGVSDSDLGQTAYGTQLSSLMRSCGPSMGVSGTSVGAG
jgi:hypothetical protein